MSLDCTRGLHPPSPVPISALDSMMWWRSASLLDSEAVITLPNVPQPRKRRPRPCGGDIVNIVVNSRP